MKHFCIITAVLAVCLMYHVSSSPVRESRSVRSRRDMNHILSRKDYVHERERQLVRSARSVEKTISEQKLPVVRTARSLDKKIFDDAKDKALERSARSIRNEAKLSRSRRSDGDTNQVKLSRFVRTLKDDEYRDKIYSLKSEDQQGNGFGNSGVNGK